MYSDNSLSVPHHGFVFPKGIILCIQIILHTFDDSVTFFWK